MCDGTEGRGECFRALILFSELLEWLDKEMFFSFGRDKWAVPDPLAWSCSFYTDGIKTSWEESRQCHSTLGRVRIVGSSTGPRLWFVPFFRGSCQCPELWGKTQEYLHNELSPLIPADAPNQDVINSELLFPECCLHKRELI